MKEKKEKANEYYPKSDIYGNCKEYCSVKNDGTMIGSVKCQSCEYCEDYAIPDKFTGNVDWIECSRIKEAIS